MHNTVPEPDSVLNNNLPDVIEGSTTTTKMILCYLLATSTKGKASCYSINQPSFFFFFSKMCLLGVRIYPRGGTPTHSCFISECLTFTSASSCWVQLPAGADPRRMSSVRNWILLPMLETWMEFLAPDFTLLPAAIVHLWEVNSSVGVRTLVALSFFLFSLFFPIKVFNYVKMYYLKIISFGGPAQ